jgi:integrase
MATQIQFPIRWLDTKRVKEVYSLTEKRLRRLRDQNLITFKKVNNYRYFYSQASLDAYFADGAVEALPQKVFVERLVPMERKISLGGKTMLRWTNNPSGRNRANCGDFSLIEEKGKNGIHYYMDWCDDKARHPNDSLSKLAKNLDVEVRPITDRAMAFEVARKVRNELYKEAENPKDKDKEKVTFGEYAEEYLTFLKAQNSRSFKMKSNVIMGRLVPHFGEYRLVDLDFSKTAEYVNMLRGEGIADSTISNHLSIFKCVLNDAADDDHMIEAKRIVKMGKFNLQPPGEREPLRKDEEDRLFAEANDLWKDILNFALNTGLRLKNVCGLRWSSVNFDAGSIVISGIESKNKKKFVIWLNPTVMEILKRLRAKHSDSEYVFMRPANGNGKKMRIKERWVQQEFKSLTKDAGIDGRCFHDLRHTFGCRLVDKGVDLLTIQAAMAHKSIQSTMVYVRPNEDKVKKAFYSLDQDLRDGVGVNSGINQ